MQPIELWSLLFGKAIIHKSEDWAVQFCLTWLCCVPLTRLLAPLSLPILPCAPGIGQCQLMMSGPGTTGGGRAASTTPGPSGWWPTSRSPCARWATHARCHVTSSWPHYVFQTEKLFMVGGLDSVSLEPILTTEVRQHTLMVTFVEMTYIILQVYDEENQTWLIHKQLPATSDKNIFVNRADSGCITLVTLSIPRDHYNVTLFM